MNELLNEFASCLRVVKRKYKDYPHLTPKEQHHLGMEAEIQARFIKRKIAEYAIKHFKPIPIRFSTLGYIITAKTPIHIKHYLFKRTNRSKWAVDINRALEFKYAYPDKHSKGH